MKAYRWLIIALVLAALLGAIGYGFMPRPVPVEVAEVRRGSLQVTLEEEGRTRVADRYTVSAPVAGMLCRIDLEVGDPVQQGQVLAHLHPLPPAVLDPRSRAQGEAAVAAANAALQAARDEARAAQADADFATRELTRLAALQRSGTISREALERAEAEARRSEARARAAESAIEVARFEREAAQAALAHSAVQDRKGETVPIRAPADGRILRLYRESECTVNRGEPLLEVGDPRDLEVVVEVLSDDAVTLRPDLAVILERWGGDQPLEGRIRRVEPTAFTKVSALGVEEQRVVVVVEILSPRQQWQGLGDGYRVETRFVLWEEQDVLQVPAGSLFRQGQDWGVFVVEDGQARLRQVRLGRRSGLTVQIEAGLETGERVIVHPDDTVAEGIDVAIR